MCLNEVFDTEGIWMNENQVEKKMFRILSVISG